MARIVPMFAQMFDAFHVELPRDDARAARRRRRAAAAGGVDRRRRRRRRSPAARSRPPRAPSAARSRSTALRLRLPVFGPLLHKAITARIARMLATLLRSGIELVTAIDVVRPVAGSPAYAAALERVDVALRAGDALTAPLEAARLFDPLAVALVRVGEETGLLDEMLLKVAAYFETDVEAADRDARRRDRARADRRARRVVGFIVFSVFIPLYSLIGSVAK